MVSMYTSGLAIVYRTNGDVMGQVDIHFNQVVYGAGPDLYAGVRMTQEAGDPYRLEVGEDGAWGDWVVLLSQGNVSHPYVVDHVVVGTLKNADLLLVQFSIGGDSEPPEHGSETESIIAGLGHNPVGSAMINAGTPLQARVREIGVVPQLMVYDNSAMWFVKDAAGKPSKLPYVDMYVVLSILPPKD